MKSFIRLTIVTLIVLSGCTAPGDQSNDRITTASLLDEMTDLNRLTMMPLQEYRIIQYSSHDRSSKKAGEPGWFSNSDGFGGEAEPGFEKVLREPDAGGTGEYLICDIRQPGAILRLWTAGINGRIRVFLDNKRKPVFEGNAQEFFWKPIESLSDTVQDHECEMAFRQSDAVYFPIAFSRKCRIEWIGNVKDIHFYHVTVRLYSPGTRVRTFKPDDIRECAAKMNEIAGRFGRPAVSDLPQQNFQEVKSDVPKGGKKILFRAQGPMAVDGLKIKLPAGYSEAQLRKCILSVYFDDSPVPQIQAPVGDFFGSAPGWTPYQSLPFSVLADSTMICRFIMPFKSNIRIEMENLSETDVRIDAGISLAAYEWTEGRSMHFHGRWRIDNGLTASDSLITDIPYLRASGKGRLVGAAAFLYNPSNVPTSWGNWWGEGDEKIFVDRDTFPSVFGTGTEDYFNYSWSSDALFSFPYSGQTRNDGPGNRGYVSNYRWHIADDIPFQEKLDLFVELWHHGMVQNFSYGRIAYYYALPGVTSDDKEISTGDVAEVPYLNWAPVAYLGSSGYTFVEAEKLISPTPGVSLEKGGFWSGGGILTWKPVAEKQTIRFKFQNPGDTARTNMGFTLAQGPLGGEVAVYLNGNLLKFNGRDFITLNDQQIWQLRNYISEKTRFNPGMNEIILENRSREKNSRIGIDFIWLKETTH